MGTYRVWSQYPEFDHKIGDISDTDLVDDLEREPMVRAIVEDIRGNERPSVIGVYGWWGAGKSYLLDLVQKSLWQGNQNNKQQTIICTFESWRYEMEGDLAQGLIKSLRDIESQKGNPTLGDTTKYKAIADFLLDLILEISPSLVPGGQALATVVGKMVKTVVKGADEYEKAKSASYLKLAVDEIKQKMQELITAILDAAYTADPSKDYRLVVFIDDLDRCSPENMVRMFEWIKVHLLVGKCTYVMALDHVAAARAIVGAYKKYLGEEQDLAYGFRYLEKLVDNEYELGLASKVELMALRQVYRDTSHQRLSDAARELCGGDFPGVRNMDEILMLRSLLNPRTMLKIVYRFKRTLKVILSEGATEFRNRLPSSYPFWVLFLIAMYYRLDPDCLDEFVRGRGNIYELMKNPGSVNSDKWGTGPMREFCKYADNFGASAGTTIQLPNSETLTALVSVIRENAFSPEA